MLYIDSFVWNLYLINLGFNLGNYVGRSLGKIKHSWSRLYLIITCISRGLLIATTFIIALNESMFWSHPATVVINSFLVGLSGGFFSVNSSSSFHSRLRNKEKEYGGFLISVMLNAGIAIGSLISLLGFQ